MWASYSEQKLLCAVAVSYYSSRPSFWAFQPLPSRKPQVHPPAPASQAQIAQLQQAVQNAQSAGDNAWMLISAALVLLMTGPGLALFYGGLVRRKNILGTMMQSFAMMGLVTVIWAVVGYSLAFGHGNAFIGGFEHLFLRGVGLDPQPRLRGHHPRADLHGLSAHVRHHHPGAHHRRLCRAHEVQLHGGLSLALVAPRLLPHGAHGLGRGRTSSTLLAAAFPASISPAARSSTSPAGVSALVTCIYLGKRIGYPHTNMAPHSMVLSFIGACLLWVGWFGFNAGSALAASSLATSAFINTHFAAAAAAIGWIDRRVDSQRQAYRPGRHFRCRCGLGRHHSGFRVRSAHVGARHRPYGRPVLLLHGLRSEEPLRLRRFARRFRRSRRRRNPRRYCSPASSPPGSSTLSSAKSVADRRHRRPLGPVAQPVAGVAIAWGISIVGTLVLLFVVDKAMGLRVSPEQKTSASTCPSMAKKATT